MLREQNKLIHRTALCIDAAVVCASFLISFMLRDDLDSSYFYLHRLPPLADYLPMLLVVIPIWILMLRALGAYDSMRGKGYGKIFWNVFEASLAATLVFATAAFMLKMDVGSTIGFMQVTGPQQSYNMWF